MTRNGKSRLEDLRRRAEECLQDLPRRLGETDDVAVEDLMHDLQVYQVELEIQNEELRNVQINMERSRDAFASLFDQAPVGYLVIDGSGRIQETNETFARMTGREIHAVKGRSLFTLIDERDQQVFLARFTALFKRPEGKRIDVRIKNDQGKAFWGRIEARRNAVFSPRSATDETSEMLMVIVSDVTEEITANRVLSELTTWLEIESKIQRSFLTHHDDDLFAEVLETVKEVVQSPLGYFGYIDHLGNLVCPSMSREIFAKCQVEDKSIVFPPTVWGGLWGRSLKEKRALLSNQGLQVPKGHLKLECAMAVPLMLSETLIGQIVVADKKGGYQKEDLRLLDKICALTAPMLFQRRRAADAEEQLRQAQKMESIGRLAGGVAHDFNNLLTGIIGNLELAEMNIDANHPSRGSLSAARDCADRSADLIQQLLAFSRKQLIQQKTFDLVQLLNDLYGMLKRVISENIQFDLDLRLPSAWVHMDASQIEQIIVNLVVNARDAMPDGGHLKIVLDGAEISPGLALDRPELDAETYVEVAVVDSGTGIPDEVRERVFEPFFTTKAPGTGTGLGLSMVYGAVMQNDGHIEIDSARNEGTTVRILFPTVEGQKSVKPKVVQGEEFRRGSGRILVVEDDSNLCELNRNILESVGYEVWTARDGRHALEVAEESAVTFDLLVTDVIMPHLNGGELAHLLGERIPGLKVLFVSGYTENAICHHGVIDEVNFLRKPFRPKALAALVGRIIAGEDDSS